MEQVCQVLPDLEQVWQVLEEVGWCGGRGAAAATDGTGVAKDVLQHVEQVPWTLGYLQMWPLMAQQAWQVLPHWV